MDNVSSLLSLLALEFPALLQLDPAIEDFSAKGSQRRCKSAERDFISINSGRCDLYLPFIAHGSLRATACRAAD